MGECLNYGTAVYLNVILPLKNVFIDMYSCHSCTCLEYSIKPIRILKFYIQDDSSIEKYNIYEKLDGNKTKC